MYGPVSRRDFLVTGGAAAGAALLGTVTGCTEPPTTAPPSPPARPAAARRDDGDLADPPVRRGLGVLTTSIACVTTPVSVAGRQVHEACTYDGSFVGPTLWLERGDWLDLTFANAIAATQSGTRPGYGRTRGHAAMTNLHFHGLHVPPTGTADNMLVAVDRNERFRYRFRIPASHPAGLFWYHPHVHGTVTNQLGRGACGMLFVASPHTRAVDARYRRRVLVLQQVHLQPDLRTLTFDDAERDHPERALTVVNGEAMPRLRLRPGERQVWDVANGSTSAFYQLRFPEGFALRVLAYDGLARGTFPSAADAVVQLAPGKRVELEVRAPLAPGGSVLALDAYFQGVDTWPAKPLAFLEVGGAPAAETDPVPMDVLAFDDLSGSTPDRRRTIVFDQDDAVPEGEFGRFRMYLEGTTPHAWDPEVPEWTDSVVGQVEEWTIRNLTGQEHPFHVHINPFQVMRVEGPYAGAPPSPVLTTGYHDTVVVPPGGLAVVRTRFEDFAGAPILMHCHILDHEDMGMMTWFRIQDG